MNSELKQYLSELKAYGIEKNIPNVTEVVGHFLNIMILIHRPKTILEIGCANGYSTLWMAEAARKAGFEDYIMANSRPTFEEAQRNFSETGFDDIICPYFGEALSIIADFPKSTYFDFVFVDGKKAAYLDFWHAIRPRLAKRAVIIFDDMIAFQKKTKPFSDFIASVPDFDSVLLPIDEGDGILLLVPND